MVDNKKTVRICVKQHPQNLYLWRFFHLLFHMLSFRSNGVLEPNFGGSNLYMALTKRGFPPKRLCLIKAINHKNLPST